MSLGHVWFVGDEISDDGRIWRFDGYDWVAQDDGEIWVPPPVRPPQK